MSTGQATRQDEGAPPTNFVRRLHPGAKARAALRLVRYGASVAVLKDYSGSRPLFRRTCAAYLARREAAAYRRLHGLPGVPRLLGRVGRDGLLLEYVPGWNCRDEGAGRLGSRFFEELREILRAVRSAGVLHMDVKRNVLVSDAGRPVLVDFGASYVIPGWLGPLRRFLVGLAAQYDEREVVKLKALIDPRQVTAEERAVLARALPLEGVVSLVEGLIQKVTFGMARWLG
jgi:hypothetical protein